MALQNYKKVSILIKKLAKSLYTKRNICTFATEIKQEQQKDEDIVQCMVVAQLKIPKVVRVQAIYMNK